MFATSTRVACVVLAWFFVFVRELKAAYSEFKKDDSWILVESNVVVTFWTAKEYCQSKYGSSLTLPRDDAQNNKLQTWKGDKRVWIGWQDYVSEGRWETLDGVALEPSSFASGKFPWSPGQPDNAGGAEDCGEVWGGAGWNDLPCTHELSYFLCGAQFDWKPVFKLTRGRPNAPFQMEALFKDGPSTPEEAQYLHTFDAASIADSVDYYRSSFIDKWTEQVSAGNVDRVKVALYKDGQEAIYFVYSASTDKTSWFSQAHYIDSSYADATTANGGKIWTMYHNDRRQFLVWHNGGGCDKDHAWMIVTVAPPYCASWGNGAGETADGSPTIWYSGNRQDPSGRDGGRIFGHMDTQALRADTMVIYVGHTSGLAYEECPVEQHLVDWDKLFVGDDPLSGTSTLTVTQHPPRGGQIKIDVGITAPYLMASKYESMKKLYDGKTPNGYLGVTYVLSSGVDFESAGRFLKDTQTCDNRVGSDFDGKNFVNDFFDASTTPSDPSALGSTQYLAYPPANIWALHMVDPVNDPCGDVIYYSTFTFDQLKQCHGFQFVDTGSTLALQGAFYVAAVSPLPWIFKRSGCLAADCGQYLTYTLQSHPITIEFAKTRVVLSRKNPGLGGPGFEIDLFTTHIVSATYDENDDTFRMDMITSAPNYMELDVSTAAILSPQESDLEGALNDNDDFLDGPLVISEETSGYPPGEACLIIDQYRCFQKFVISARVKDCAKARLFDGDYYFTADFNCAPGKDDVCNDYLRKHPRTITLDTVKLEYTEGCDKSVYDVAWGGEIFFYADGTFTDPPLTTATYMKGDTVYTRVQVATVAEYSVVGMHIGAAYLCGSDNTKLPPEGCLAGVAKGIDTLVYDIINDPGMSYQLINGNNKDEFEDFSFVLPVVADNTFFVHVDCVLDIVSPTTRRLMQMPQRLLLTIDPSASAFQTYIGRGTIVNGQHNPLDIMKQWQWFNAYVMLGIFMALTLFGLSSLLMRKKKSKKSSAIDASLHHERTPLLINA